MKRDGCRGPISFSFLLTINIINFTSRYGTSPALEFIVSHLVVWIQGTVTAPALKPDSSKYTLSEKRSIKKDADV